MFVLIGVTVLLLLLLTIYLVLWLGVSSGVHLPLRQTENRLRTCEVISHVVTKCTCTYNLCPFVWWECLLILLRGEIKTAVDCKINVFIIFTQHK